MIALLGVERGQWAHMNALIAEWLHIGLDAFEDDLDELVRARFPAVVVLQHADKCLRALRELLIFAEDRYEHSLDPLHAHALFKTLEDATAQEGDWIKDVSHDPAEKLLHEQRKKDLGRLLEDAFRDLDFLDPETIANDVLANGGMRAQLGIDAARFVELMPDDVAARVLDRLKAAEERRPVSSPTGYARTIE